MFDIKKHVLAATFTVFALGGAHALAQDAPLADGKLSKQELAAILLTAEQQLTLLAETATKKYLPVIQEEGINMPKAWMLMEDGETVKGISLQGQAEGAPPEIRIVMYRSAIKSLARRGLINAAAILYAGAVTENDDTKALVIEHEHRLGVSANKVVGYRKDKDRIVWGEPFTEKKPFEWFYEAKVTKNPS